MPDVLCLGNEWNEHDAHCRLLARLSSTRRVFFVQEAKLAHSHPYLEMRSPRDNLWLIRPHLTVQFTAHEHQVQLRAQLALMALEHRIVRPVLWYMNVARAAALSRVPASLVVCGPIPEQRSEEELGAWSDVLRRADLVVPHLGGIPDALESFWGEDSTAMRLLCATPHEQVTRLSA